MTLIYADILHTFVKTYLFLLVSVAELYTRPAHIIPAYRDLPAILPAEAAAKAGRQVNFLNVPKVFCVRRRRY